MKFRLLLALVAVVLLLGALVHWNTPPAPESAPAIPQPEGSEVAESPPELSAEALGRLEVDRHATRAQDARAGIDPPPPPEPGLEADLSDRKRASNEPR